MMYGKQPPRKSAIQVLRQRPVPNIIASAEDDEEAAAKKKAALDAAKAQIPNEIAKQQRPLISSKPSKRQPKDYLF